MPRLMVEWYLNRVIMRQLFSAVDVEIRVINSNGTSPGVQRGLGWATGALLALSRLGEPSALDHLVRLCVSDDLVALRAGLNTWTGFTRAPSPHWTRAAGIFLSTVWPAITKSSANNYTPLVLATKVCFIPVFLHATAVVTPQDINSMGKGLKVRWNDMCLMTCTSRRASQDMCLESWSSKL